MRRRQVLALLAIIGFSKLAIGWGGKPLPVESKEAGGTPLPPLLADLERRTFDFFWETAHPDTGLVPDRWPSNPRLCSIAAVGFALTAYPIGVEQGYISRAQARQRSLQTLSFLAQLPQGEGTAGCAGYRGFFYHFLDMQTGLRFDPKVELSSIDTALLLAGALFAASYFCGEQAEEVALRQLAGDLYGRVQWPWLQQSGGLIGMGWLPETGMIEHAYQGYDEAMLLYLLAMGAPQHSVGSEAWQAFCKTYPATWGDYMGQTHLGGAPLFWHQYSHVWVDYRGIQDDFMRAKGLDYFENSRRASLAQRAYAIANPQLWQDYGADIWGWTACDGPGDFSAPDHLGRQRQFMGYAARGVGLRDSRDDGTIAPTAAASALPFAPLEAMRAIITMHGRFGEYIYGRYGFFDAFNRSLSDKQAKLSDGRVIPGWGWVASDYLGIDQGPILTMLANHRNDLVWRYMRKQAALRQGLQKAGFRGGWLAA